MRLHNFIVDFREKDSDSLKDRAVFGEDCCRFLTVNEDVDEEGGVHGGKADIHRDASGNAAVGRRPTKAYTNLAKVDKA